jgi:hypothetical protein
MADDEGCRDRDRPLGFHFRAPDLARELGLPPARNAAYEAARASILLEAILAEQEGKAVSYSRNKDFYRAIDRYHGYGITYTYRTVLDSVAELAHHNLIEDHKVPPGNLGWQSSFYATGKLMQAWPSTAQRIEYFPGEIIRLKNSDGELMGYSDTDRTRRMRRQQAARNEALADLEIDVPAAEKRGLHLVIDNGPTDDDGDRRKLSYVLPHPGNPMWRVFSRGSWNMHGRAYGWFQSIPGQARASMTINGQPVAEIDYSALHITMLYNEAGIRLDRPPYEVDGLERGEVKLGINIAFNAKSKPATVAALADKLGKGRGHAAKIVDAILSHNSPIGRAFCSDAGIRLMRRDADIILAAQDTLNAKGVACLPVHDSMIVPTKDTDVTMEAMVTAFDRFIGGPNPCNLKVKSPKARSF